MKKVGITPGPVKFENMEPNDVKQFTPSNTGTEGQILTKTSNGYNWKTPPDVKEFTPSNTGTTGQVLTKTSNGYNWKTPPDVKQFTPSNAGSTGQVLTKTNNGYNWATPSGGGGGGGSNVGFNFIDEESTSVFPDGNTDILTNSPKTFNAIINYSISLYDENNNHDGFDNLTASVVFNADSLETYYIANASLSCSKMDVSVSNSKYYVIINGMFKCIVNQGEVLACDIEFYGTAMFSKTPSPQASGALQNIRNVIVLVTGITIRMNE